MKELKMILSDNTAIVLSEVNLPLHIVVVRDTREEVLSLWDKLTPENLTEVVFQEDGETLFTFVNCGVMGEQIVVNADGTMTGHYYLDGERLPVGNAEYEEAARILLGEVE